MSSRQHIVSVTPRSAPSYDVVVSRGLLDQADRFVPSGVSSLALVCDHRVRALYGERVSAALARTGLPVVVTDFPPGEASKTRAAKERIEDALFQAGLDRASLVVALGGGVTSDLAGFVAATFMRGVRSVNLPTTLLAMVDATVGGKTGVDTPAGKNLVGAFHQPVAVAADVACLETLDSEQMAGGLAEMIKHAVIADAQALEEIEDQAHALDDMDLDAWAALVARSVGIKAEVVSQDPWEQGLRRILNFGHTVGHALELLSGWRLGHAQSHGPAMAAEAEIAHRLGLLARAPLERIRSVLRRFDLLQAPPSPVLRALAGHGAPFVQALARDKKNLAGRVRMALPRDIGVMEEAGGRWVLEVSADLALQVISDLWLRP